MAELNKPLFKLGQVVATPAAIEAIEQTKQTPWEFVGRHVQGDFGLVDAEDRQANEHAIKDGSRIFSAYILNDGKTRLWVITEAQDDNGNREATTLLLPDEY